MADKKKSSKTNSKPSAPQAPVKPSAPIRLKVLSMGSSSCGKSCLIKRFCEERFVSKYIATIGVDYGVKPVQIDGVDVRINFWDLSGHPEFFEIRNEFYKDGQAIVLAYDVSNRETFEELDGWIEEATKYGANPREISVVLCANKIDKRRLVTEDEGRHYATMRGFAYFETSASTGDGVMEMFNSLFETTLRRLR